MDNNRRFEIENKIITVDQIIEAAEYMEKIKDYYVELIKKDKEKNGNKYFEEGEYSYYAHYMPRVEYSITYTDGRDFKGEDIQVFKDALTEPQYINKVSEYIYVGYKDNELNEVTEHSMHVTLSFENTSVFFKTSDMNMGDPAYNLNSYLRSILEKGENRFSGVVKHRIFIKNIIGLAVGSILTLVLFFILLSLKKQGDVTFDSLFSSGFILCMVGWLSAFAFGSIIVAPIVNNLYKEIEKDWSIVWGRSKFDRDKYKDSYSKYNEILIGENYNNLEKRKMIEKLYKASKVIILIRLIISVIIFVIVESMI